MCESLMRVCCTGMWSHGSELRQKVSHPIHSFAELLCAPRRARLTRFLSRGGRGGGIQVASLWTTQCTRGPDVSWSGYFAKLHIGLLIIISPLVTSSTKSMQALAHSSTSPPKRQSATLKCSRLEFWFPSAQGDSEKAGDTLRD